MKSLVQIYFQNFSRDKSYCVEIKALKIKEAEDPADAVVTVYDYNLKGM